MLEGARREAGLLGELAARGGLGLLARAPARRPAAPASAAQRVPVLAHEHDVALARHGQHLDEAAHDHHREGEAAAVRRLDVVLLDAADAVVDDAPGVDGPGDRGLRRGSCGSLRGDDGSRLMARWRSLGGQRAHCARSTAIPPPSMTAPRRKLPRRSALARRQQSLRSCRQAPPLLRRSAQGSLTLNNWSRCWRPSCRARLGGLTCVPARGRAGSPRWTCRCGRRPRPAGRPPPPPCARRRRP